MRRLFWVLALLIFGISHSFSEELNAEQLRFRTDVFNFIKEEGFAPYIDDTDNSIMFKREGVQFWITVEDGSPFYIEFHREGMGCKDADAFKVLWTVNSLNKRKKCTKCIMKTDTISVVIELFCHSSEEFKYTFYKSIKALNDTESELKDTYASAPSSL